MELKLPNSLWYSDGTKLLIVPYGIETQFGASSAASIETFNRTLWN